MPWGTSFGTHEGPAGMAAGATVGALKPVGQGVINHDPVKVHIPVLMEPSWNGSGNENNTPKNFNNSG